MEKLKSFAGKSKTTKKDKWKNVILIEDCEGYLEY